MNSETVSNEAKSKTWERTPTPGLLKHRSGTYYARLSEGGKNRFISLGTKVAGVAQDRFNDHKTRVVKGRRAARKAGDGTGKMADYFTLHRADVIADGEIAEGTRKRYLEHLGYIEKTWPALSSLRPDQVTQEAVRKWRNHATAVGTEWRPPGAKTAKTGGKSPGTFNKALEMLKRLVDMAVLRGAVTSNPLRVRARGKDRLRAKGKPKKAKLPSRAQLDAIFAKIEDGTERGGWARETADFVRFLAYTGARKGEAAQVTWDHVSFDRGMIEIHGTKTDAAARKVPMNQAARALLEKIRARREASAKEARDGKPYVPPSDRVLGVREAQGSLDKACEAVGVPRLTHHDFRDVFCTTCIEAGVDIPTLAGWVGHADGGALLMRTYTDIRNEHSKAEALKVNF